MRTQISTVACNEFPYIRTVALLNTRRNEWTKEFPPFRDGFDWDGIQEKADIFVLVILHK